MSPLMILTLIACGGGSSRAEPTGLTPSSSLVSTSDTSATSDTSDTSATSDTSDTSTATSTTGLGDTGPTGGTGTLPTAATGGSGATGDTGTPVEHGPVIGIFNVFLGEPDRTSVSFTAFDTPQGWTDDFTEAPVTSPAGEPCLWRSGLQRWGRLTAVDVGPVGVSWGGRDIVLAFDHNPGPHWEPNYEDWGEQAAIDWALDQDIGLSVPGSATVPGFDLPAVFHTSSQRIDISEPSANYVLPDDLVLRWTPGASGPSGMLHLVANAGDGSGPDLLVCEVLDDGEWTPPPAFFDAMDPSFANVSFKLQTEEPDVTYLPDGRMLWTYMKHQASAVAYVVPTLP